MFDARLRPLIDPALNRAGQALARVGFTANIATVLGIALALLAAGAIATEHYGLALALVVANRLLDGLDGAIARATQMTFFGGYLDIVGDFIFYSAIPVGFALAADTNTLPAAVLLASFSMTGVSFLAFAAIAAEKSLETEAHGRKSFFYSTGLAEGAETIAAFVLMCLIPQHFAAIAYAYAALCVVTVAQRTALAWRVFSADQPNS